MEKGATPNTQDNARWTPLHEVAQKGFTEIARVLLENGANPNVPGMINELDCMLAEIEMVLVQRRRMQVIDGYTLPADVSFFGLCGHSTS